MPKDRTLCSHSRSFVGDSAFHGGGYTTKQSRKIFCDVCRLQRWLDVEAALARSQASLGMIPAEAAERITKAAKIDKLDQPAIAKGIQELGHSLVPLLRQLEVQAGSYASQYIHYGATTQDIQDTGQSLEFRDVLDVVEADLNTILDKLEPLALEHKEQLMVGRTHAQPALPTTFGLKVASWIDELTRHVQRLYEARGRLQVAQLYGGVGTMAAFRGEGPKLIKVFAEELGLNAPVVGWHVARDRVSEFLFLLATIGQTLARLADELRTLSRPPFGEVYQRRDPQSLGSSTMPHKRNPEQHEQVVVLARIAKAMVPLGLEAMIVEHERDYRGTRLEWPAISESSHVILTALSLTKTIISDLIVRGDVMTKTATDKADAECTEALTFSLGMRIGKSKAFRLVHKLSQDSIDNNLSLREQALVSPELTAVMEESRIKQIFDPSSYLGSSLELVENVVAESRRVRGKSEE